MTTSVPYKRIATEEAWAPPSLLETYRTMAAKKSIDDPGFIALWNRLGSRGQLVERLGDIGERRIADMDASGIDMQILSLTSPGVQVFDAATATSLATDTNDQLAEAIRRYPTRFAGLAAAAPQDPKSAVEEIDRAVRQLGLKGMIINSHTRGEMLDDPKFWEIFEAAEALNVPIYIHPQAPSAGDDRARTSSAGSRARCGALPPRPVCTCWRSSAAARSIASRACDSSSATSARRCRSGCSGSTT